MPFEVFRRHQRKILAVLAIMAMIAFVFDPQTISSLLGFGGRPDEADKAIAEIYGHPVSGQQLRSEAQRRSLANQFVFSARLMVGSEIAILVNQLGPEAVERTLAAAPQFGPARARQVVQEAAHFFGGTDEQSLLDAMILRHKADQLGIVVSDDSVNRFIQTITDDRLLPEQLRNIRNQRLQGISEDLLYQMLRDELRIRRVSNLFGLSGLTQPTPDVLWDHFQKFHNKVGAEVVPVAVAYYLDQVPEPSEQELTELFEKYKDREPNSLSPDPGFKQPRRVKGEYVVASFDVFKGQVKVSEQEVRDFYEKNKERYRLTEDADELPLPKIEEESGLVPVLQPEGGGAEKQSPETGQLEKSTHKPAATGEKTAEGAANPPDDEEEDQDVDSAGVGSEEKAETAGQSATEGASSTPAPKPSSSAEPPGKADAGAGAPTSSAPARSEPAAKDGSAAGAQKAEAEPRYRALDDKLAQEIRDEIQRDRAIQEMLAHLDKIAARMRDYGSKYEAYRAVDPKKKAAQPKERPAPLDLKALAAAEGLQYVVPPALSAAEADSLAGIGGSFEPDPRGSVLRGDSFAKVAFSNEALLLPLTFKDNQDNYYLFWKLEDQPAHVPDFPDVNEAVRLAFKTLAARELAKAKAEKMASFATAEGNNVATVESRLRKAADEEPKLPVLSTGLFSRMTQRYTFNPDQPFPFAQVDSEVPNVDRAGTEFMDTAFSLQAGQAGVAPNAPESVYYAIAVTDRQPAKTEDFFSRWAAIEMQYLQEQTQETSQRWMEDQRKEAGLKMISQKSDEEAAEETARR